MTKSLFDQVATILQGIDTEQTAEANGWWETSVGAKFGAEKLQELRALLGARASLPVGVPDGLFLGDALLMWNRRHDNPPIKVDYEYGVADALLQIMGAPTVKAEQVQVAMPKRKPRDWQCSGGIYPADGWNAALDEVARLNPAPSLPAAGSSDLTAVRCQCCATEYPHDSYDAGFIAGSGMCQVCDAAMPPKDLPAAGSAVEEVPEEWRDKDHLVSLLADVVGRERMRRDRLPDLQFAKVIYKAIGEHLPIYEDVYDQCSSIIEPYVARPHRPDGMLPGSVVDSLRLLLQHRLSALSAQQSAPERVSVPVEVAIALLDDGKRTETWAAQDELRALLGRHGRGDA